MSKSMCSCKVCGKRFEQNVNSYSLFYGATRETYGTYKNQSRLVEHVEQEHPEVVDKEIKKAIRKLKKKVVKIALLETLIQTPITLVLIPLFVLKRGLEKFFDNYGDLW